MIRKTNPMLIRSKKNINEISYIMTDAIKLTPESRPKVGCVLSQLPVPE